MFCTQCRAELPSGANFCPECGCPVGQSGEGRTVKSVRFECKGCHAVMTLKEGSNILKCPFCDSTELIVESDAVAKQRIKSNAYRDVEFGWQQLEREKMQHQAEREKAQAVDLERTKFKKSKFSKFLIICAIVSSIVCALELSDGFSISGLIALLQALLYLTSWLTGSQILKAKQKRVYVLEAVIAFALIIPFFIFLESTTPDTSGNTANQPENIAWSTLELHEKLPQPDLLYGEVGTDLTAAMSLTLYGYSESEFDSYVDECVAFGYIIESEDSGTSYIAFDDEGYQVRLVYGGTDDKTLWIHLDAPERMGEFEWPTSGLGSKLPETKSTTGNIHFDNSTTFIVHVGNMSIDDFDDYVKACEEKGFNRDYSKSDVFYSASNRKGYLLTLHYLGFNCVEICIEIPEDS